jgi:predicted SAM-dependent methyltransferase
MVSEKNKNNIARLTGIRLATIQDLTWDLRLWILRLKNRLIPARRKCLHQLGSLCDVSLHFGCGPRCFPGWVNVDAFPHPGLTAELDLRFPLPLKDGSCRFIFAEHILEHFTASVGESICGEFFRLLKQGGVARIIVPDAEKYWQAYLSRDREWFEAAKAAGETPMASINGIFYGHFHRCMYDYELLSWVLQKAGFTLIMLSAYRASAYPELNLERDETFRRESSLYVEVTKT